MTNILTSNAAKQFFGACAGMAIAGVVYVGMNHVSNLSIKGLLVDTTTVTSTGTSINAKDADEATIRRIAQRAATVAATLENSRISPPAETPITAAAAERRAERIAGISTSAVVPSTTGSASSFAVPAEVTTTTGVATVIDTVPMHAGAEVVPVIAKSTNLPHSGLGLNLLVLVTLASAFALSKTTWRSELTSMIQRLRIG